jgi:glycosyltransferase involved in cell wall biosynthesis
MKISIVTLSFNQAIYLEECINSVLNQSYSDWELFIIDPGSDDSSREIAKKFANIDPRITLIFERDNGPSDGLNKGFKRASGEIVGCLNSDDFYNQGTFSEVAKAFTKYVEADCIYSHGMILKSDQLRFQSSDRFSVNRYFSNRGLVIQQSTFFRNSELIQDRIKFNVENRTSWDGEFLVDLASMGANFKKVRGNWGVFRIYEGSITGSQRLQIETRKDHSRMLKQQVLNGLKFSIFEKMILKFKFYSVYRRVRNHLVYFSWAITKNSNK